MELQSDQSMDWLQAGDQKRASASYEWLTRFMGILRAEETQTLHRSLASKRDAYLALLTTYPPMCKAVERFRADLREGLEHGHDPDDIRLLQPLGAMCHVLLLGFEEHNAAEDILDALAGVHRRVVLRQLDLAKDQVDALCGFVLHIHDFLGRLTRPTGRTILTELPVGNSVPVKMLARLLGDHSPVEVRTVSLSRNDSVRAGVTRRELLAADLSAASPQKDDVIVYMDEWNSGANFRTLCEIHKKCLPPAAYFLPAALLTDRAAREPQYQSMCSAHDRLLKPWGVDPDSFRRVLPPLPSTIGGEYFFWSEHDRTAGYRKMQLYGSLFSTLDAAVAKLRQDDVALRMAARLLVAEEVPDAECPCSPTALADVVVEEFAKGHEDYLRCREEILRAGDGSARGGLIDEFDAAMQPLTQELVRIADHRDAKMVIVLAMAYMQRFGTNDPEDRYFYKTHAPVLVRLDGRAGATHRLTMEHLAARLDALRRR